VNKRLFIIVSVGTLLCLSIYQNCSKQSFENRYGNASSFSSDDEAIELDNDEISDIEEASEKIDVVETDAEGLHICILEGSGKSVRLGLVGENQLGEIGSTQNAVCMSKEACLNIVSQRFDVVSAEKRGFCKGKSPQVFHLSSAQLRDLLDL